MFQTWSQCPTEQASFSSFSKDTVSSTPGLCITCLLCLNSLFASLKTLMCHALCGFYSPGKARGSFLVFPRLSVVACDLHPSRALRDLAFLQVQPKGHDSLSLKNFVAGQIQCQPRPGPGAHESQDRSQLLRVFHTVDPIFPLSQLFPL